MSTITDLELIDSGSTSRITINDNFDNLNTDKAEITGQTFTGKVKFSGTTYAGLELISLTTTERDALTPVNGDLIYNETTSKVQMYQGSAWIDVTSVAADASTTVKGIAEKATDVEVEAGTETGDTGAQLFVGADSSHLPNDNEMAALAGSSGTPSGSNKFITADDVAVTATASKIVRADGSNKIDDDYLNISDTNAAILTDGSNASALHIHGQYSVILGSRTTDAADAAITYAHGLTGTPDRLKITATCDTNAYANTMSIGTFDGTNNKCVFLGNSDTTGTSGQSTTYAVVIRNKFESADNASGVVTVDGTNVTITWTKTGTPTSDTINLLIESWID